MTRIVFITRVVVITSLLAFFSFSAASAQEWRNQQSGTKRSPDLSRFVESGRKQYIEFEGFTVEEGVYKPKPGWFFTKGQGGTIVVARMSAPGVIITPCACALETGGSCAQASSEGPGGDITEIWCEDLGCGFCVGGTAEPEPEAKDGLKWVRFNVVCIKGRKASQN
jgi:hypothetical protein